MEFIITRTSLYDEKPCREAFKMKVPHWHTRTCTEKYFNKKFGNREGEWRSKGISHKEVPAQNNKGLCQDNWITRQEDDREVWKVEINSLEDLLKLEENYGRLVISTYDYGGESNIKEIEIYDCWRE